MVFWVWDPGARAMCVCDLGRCVHVCRSTRVNGELRTEKAVSGLRGSRDLDALTPVGH